MDNLQPSAQSEATLLPVLGPRPVQEGLSIYFQVGWLQEHLNSQVGEWGSQGVPHSSKLKNSQPKELSG